jgi:hypothetical protein
MKDSTDRHYMSSLTSQEMGYSESLDQALGRLKDEYPYEYPSANNSNNYSKREDTDFERLMKGLDERRNYQ